MMFGSIPFEPLWILYILLPRFGVFAEVDPLHEPVLGVRPPANPVLAFIMWNHVRLDLCDDVLERLFSLSDRLAMFIH